MKIESHPLFSPLVPIFQFWLPIFQTLWKSEKRGPDWMLDRGGLYFLVLSTSLGKFAKVYYQYVVYWIMPHIHSAANLQSRIQLVTTTWKSLYCFELWNSGMKSKEKEKLSNTTNMRIQALEFKAAGRTTQSFEETLAAIYNLRSLSNCVNGRCKLRNGVI
jgi:hypothetical protein